MAELSQQDVTRAVTEATREMREGILRLTQQIQRFNSLEAQVNIMRQEIVNMRRQINATNIQVSNVLNRPATAAIDTTAATRWQQLGNSIHAIDARLVVMEKYLMQVSDYIAIVSDKTREDEEYRSM
jgi:uncharacterized phage infection (PIP) family protein YhgE